MLHRPERLDRAKVEEIAAAVALIGTSEPPEINTSVTEQRSD
jgi:hypothetical protein